MGWHKAYLDHVHEIEINYVKHFDGLLCTAGGGQSLFVRTEAHRGDRCHIYSESFDEFNALYGFTPKLEMSVGTCGKNKVVLGAHQHVAHGFSVHV
jgi:hypothetical protein